MKLLAAALLATRLWAAPAEGQAPQAPSLSSLLLELGEAQLLANEAPEAGIPRLEAVLEALTHHPEALANDEAALQARLDALLILARARLNTGDDSGAAQALDEAIRCAHGAELDAASLGPSMAQLEAGRREALSERGTLTVQCTVDCHIYVDERRGEADQSLPAGSYRVHITAVEGGHEALTTTVDIAANSPSIELLYGPADSADRVAELAPPADLTSEPPQMSRRTGARLLPRWAEVTGLVVGLAGVAAGATLLVLDGRCQGGGPVTGPDACDNLYSTDIAGFSALGAGAAITAASGVLLTVDELRVRKGQLSSISLKATIRF